MLQTLFKKMGKFDSANERMILLFISLPLKGSGMRNKKNFKQMRWWKLWKTLNSHFNENQYTMNVRVAAYLENTFVENDCEKMIIWNI